MHTPVCLVVLVSLLTPNPGPAADGRAERSPRKLMIEVRVDRHDYAREQRFRAGDQGQRSSSEFAFSLRERGNGRVRPVQPVRALEGQPAWIRIDQRVPVYEMAHSQDPRGNPRQRYRIAYKAVTRGFHVVPRLHGQQVSLALYEETALPGHTGHFDKQESVRLVEGKLGEWIELGSAHSKGLAVHEDAGQSASIQARDRQQLSVRVIPLL